MVSIMMSFILLPVLLHHNKGEIVLTDPETKSLKDEGIFQSGDNIFQFDVKTCHDADINLFPAFFINIGGWSNTKAILYRNTGTELQKVKEYSGVLLNCFNYSPFWISVNLYQFRFGSGSTKDINTIISYDSQCPNFFSDLYLSSNFGITAHWRISSGEINYNNGHFCGITKSCSVMASLMSVQSRSNVECASVCKSNEDCRLIRYDKSTKLCHMFSGDYGLDEIISEKIFWKC